jgi:signal transduction histidine kinase
MSQWFMRLGFGKKIQLLINLVSISVLLLAISVISLSFYGQFKSNLEDRVLQKSNLLADAAAVGVVFDQPESVNMLLSSLSVDGGVSSAVVFKKHSIGDYQYFAHYDKGSEIAAKSLVYKRGPVKVWQDGYFTLRLPILVDNEEVGRIILTEDDDYLSKFVSTTLMYMIPVVLVSMLFVWLMSKAIQNRLAAPLGELIEVVHQVSYKQDYSKQVRIVSDDEFGELGNAFNQMLLKLDEHERFRVEKEMEIIQLNAELEDKVYERTRDLRASLDDLKHTQQQLVEQEKMASLGELVAGVAHEINTPIGVGITAVSHMDESISRIKTAFAEGKLTKKDFTSMLSAINESADIIGSNLNRAADLVKAFKSVAVDQSSAQQRQIDLQEYIQDILTSLRPKLKRSQHEITVKVPDRIELYCDPGAISQIITNLLMNSLNHAFAQDEVGHIVIAANITGETLHLTYSDDGQGIDSDILNRLFDPFVTTKRGQGGSGLGTHTIYNLVTQGLGGRIQCVSEEGQGCRFEITLPMSRLVADENNHQIS